MAQISLKDAKEFIQKRLPELVMTVRNFIGCLMLFDLVTW